MLLSSLISHFIIGLHLSSSEKSDLAATKAREDRKSTIVIVKGSSQNPFVILMALYEL